jgi:SNF2 family DNA or RNA helicase
VLILTYNKLAGWVDVLADWANYVIFKEVHELRRGADTAKGTAAAHLASRVRYRLGLTATPVYNYAGEAHAIVDILSPGALGTRDEFVREWGATSWSNHVKVADPAVLGSYLREQGIMLGRTRKDVGRELPKTIKVTQLVDSDPAALDAVTGNAAALAQLILHTDTERFDRFRAAGEIDMLMRQATGIAKAPFVAEFVRLLLDSEDKIVLFGWHRAVYDIWLDRLAEFNPVLYTGTETPNQKGAALDAFKNGNSRVLIMSLRSGSGVDGLQKVAKVAVFGELDWSPQVHEQGIGRLRRDGIGEPPVAYFLVSEEGSDPLIAEVLQVKRQQGEQLVSPDGRLFDNATADLNRTRLLAEAAIARAMSR